jgi:ribosome-associated protein
MQEPLEVRSGVVIPGNELEIDAVRSSGPGGQNVNKVASKIELRFDLRNTQALSGVVKGRLQILAKNKLDADGRILITSQKTRDQHKNLEDARGKLVELVLSALVEPTPRVKTRPTRGAKERRLGEKKERGSIKKARRGKFDD